MTYAKSNSVTATDYNSLVGTTSASAPYASSAAATQKVAALWGVGYGDRGYGQLSPVLPKKVVGNPNERLWLCIPSGDGNADGGWNTGNFAIDRTKKYRSTVWIKVLNGSGSVYHGPGPFGDSNVCNLDGSTNSNPYWYSGSASNLVPGQWYLSVGIIHESTYTGGNSGASGLYDINGNQVIQYIDYKHSPTATYSMHRCYHYYDSDSTQRQWFARPRYELYDGSQPSVTTLLTSAWNAIPYDTMIAPSAWFNQTTDVAFTNYVGTFQPSYSTGTETQIIAANGAGPTGHTIKAQDFLDLRAAIQSMAAYQGIATTLLPPTSEFAVGGTIKSEVPATTSYDFPTMIANIDNNRLVASAANMSVTNLTTITRGSTWGNGDAYIQCQFGINFASENAARYFFNSGGTINIALAHPNTSTPQDSNWNSILASVGTVKIGARSSARTGTVGLLYPSVGYYNLTGSYTAIVDGTNVGTGAYSANDFLIDAYVTGVAGVNGGNGTSVVIRITIWDSHTNSFYDVVQAGTNAVISYTKAATVLTNIPAPSLALSYGF